MMQGEQSYTTGEITSRPKYNGEIRKRGRPKGATSATLSEVRAQAAEEKKRLREELQDKIMQLKQQLVDVEAEYQQEVTELRKMLKVTRKREASYRKALDSKLGEVADHLHNTLLDWAKAELEEAAVYKRKRGRPRKTLK